VAFQRRKPAAIGVKAPCGCSGHPAFPTPSVVRAENFATARTLCAARMWRCVFASLRGANGSRERAPDRLRDEAIYSFFAR
jgi:hypothetical protein